MQVWLIACFQIQPKSNYCCDDEEKLPHGVMHQDSNWAAYITINLGLLHARCDVVIPVYIILTMSVYITIPWEWENHIIRAYIFTDGIHIYIKLAEKVNLMHKLLSSHSSLTKVDWLLFLWIRNKKRPPKKEEKKIVKLGKGKSFMSAHRSRSLSAAAGSYSFALYF